MSATTTRLWWATAKWWPLPRGFLGSRNIEVDSAAKACQKNKILICNRAPLAGTFRAGFFAQALSVLIDMTRHAWARPAHPSKDDSNSNDGLPGQPSRSLLRSLARQ
jgi:hypothetical protein